MPHQATPETFIENYQRALANPRLQRAMSSATLKFTSAHRKLVSESDSEWEQLRTRAREIKQHTLRHLDYYLEEFSSNVEQHNGQVFWARDAAAANRYVADVAARRGVSLVVKGKSMMTEEIALNQALEAVGLQVVETDFGEYIAQLAGESPSHINMPIVHKTRSEVADLFAEKLHVERSEEINDLAWVARRLLREKFAAAEMGITGVNFAVAETGTIALIENEGNIRLTTSLPRVHIAVMGIEKVIPRFADLEAFLRLLPRSASGQKITANVSLLTGAKRAQYDEGPDEFHVIILDNGRTDILANPHLRESLLCIRCGGCLNVCPVYQKIGGHAYGSVYPGPIGAVLTPQLMGRDRAEHLPFASTLCGACRDVCPLKIDIPDMLLRLRSEIKTTAGTLPAGKPQARVAAGDARRSTSARRLAGLKRRLSGRLERAIMRLWGMSVKNARNYEQATRVARFVQKTFGQHNGHSRNSLPIRRWTATRDLPPLPERSFRNQWKDKSKLTDSREDK